MCAKATVRDVFESEGSRFEVYDTQLDHPDYDTLLLAWRTPVTGGRRSRVLLKRLLRSPHREQRERAWEEIQLASYLSHDNIAQVFGLVSRGEEDFVVMESLHGLYLLTAMDFALLSNERLSPAFAAYVAAEVADALDYAHHRHDSSGHPLHIIHRAVSPVRIRLGFDGRIKLTNFGAAYSDLRGRKPSPDGLLRGDPAYCAPEVLRAALEPNRTRSDPLISGAIEGRADVFSLGLVLLEMLTAEYPFDPTSQLVPKPPAGFAQPMRTERSSWLDLDSLAFRRLRFTATEVERLTESVPEPLRVIIRRALQPESSQRLEAGQMRDALRSYLVQLPRPFDRYALEEEVTRLHARVYSLERKVARPVERTAFMPEGSGGSTP
ncbi:MAG: protein kinase [Cystobacter sp.]